MQTERNAANWSSLEIKEARSGIIKTESVVTCSDKSDVMAFKYEDQSWIGHALALSGKFTDKIVYHIVHQGCQEPLYCVTCIVAW